MAPNGRCTQTIVLFTTAHMAPFTHEHADLHNRTASQAARHLVEQHVAGLWQYAALMLNDATKATACVRTAYASVIPHVVQSGYGAFGKEQGAVATLFAATHSAVVAASRDRNMHVDVTPQHAVALVRSLKESPPSGATLATAQALLMTLDLSHRSVWVLRDVLEVPDDLIMLCTSIPPAHQIEIAAEAIEHMNNTLAMILSHHARESSHE